MAVELNATEIAADAQGPLALAFVKIDGDSTGNYFVVPDPTAGYALHWVPNSEGFTVNARNGFDIPKFIWTQALFDFLTDDGNDFHFYVATPKP
jgi:hypothetical protein